MYDRCKISQEIPLLFTSVNKIIFHERSGRFDQHDHHGGVNARNLSFPQDQLTSIRSSFPFASLSRSLPSSILDLHNPSGEKLEEQISVPRHEYLIRSESFDFADLWRDSGEREGEKGARAS